ncbi:odorant receptor 13a-like isoform X2 [Megalopta genalis]|uniref:odorant receptor 13a-like isoform X2 n=1 Tax=Megalopta genalis TaxID=115081 RepID=UPI003FD41A43
MFDNVTPEKAIAFVRFSVFLIGGWPLSSMATKAQVLCFRMSKVFSALNALGLLLPVSYAMIVNEDDAIEFSKAASMLCACCHTLTQILLCSIHYERFRRLIETINAALKNAKSYERCVFQRYVDTYSMFYGLASLWYYLSTTVVVFGSIILPQPFPAVSKYPFRVDYEPVRTIIFVQQAIVGFQCSATVCVNMFAALLILYTSARFEILMIDVKEATSVDALVMCVKKYHVVTRFAKDVVKGTKYIALFTVVYGGIALVLCGLNIIGRQSFLVKLQFCFLAWVTLVEVFMCVLPADNLLNVSENTVRCAYESKWYEQMLDVQKTVLRVLVPQVPVAISVKCVIPILSLEFYCSFISNVVSLFTLLRMVFGDDADLLSSKPTNSTCCVN